MCQANFIVSYNNNYDDDDDDNNTNNNNNSVIYITPHSTMLVWDGHPIIRKDKIIR